MLPAPRSRSSASASALTVLLASLPLGCDCLGLDASPPQADTRSLSGTLTTSDGAPPSDYLVLGLSPESAAASTPDAEGKFDVTVSNVSTSTLLAVPRDGSGTATKYQGGKGLYLSPVFGGKHLASGTGPLALTSAGGPTRIDSKTTVLAALFLHPLLANPDAAASQQSVAWLLDQANGGWPELDAAVSAYDATLTSTDAAAWTAFVSAMDALLASLSTALPAELVKAEGLGSDSSGLESNPNTTVVSDGKQRMSVSVDDPAGPTITVDAAVGTNLDYLCVARHTAKADFPSGKDSAAFMVPDRQRATTAGSTIRSAFVGAKSYASYLDIVGNSIGKVTELIGGATVGPNSAIPVGVGEVTEVRCFSGGYGIDTGLYDFIQAHHRADARSAFVHNITAATIEVLSALPGGDAAAQSDVGKQVLQKVIQQAVAEVEAKTNSQGMQVGASDIYEIIYNVSRAGLNEFIDKSTDEWKEGKLEKLKSFIKWGGKNVVKFINVSGKLANAGAAGSRAYALARPQSLLEYFLVAVDDDTADAGAKADGGSGLPPLWDEMARACRKLIDNGCVDGMGCPSTVPITDETHPYRQCAIDGNRCILAAPATCQDMFACRWSSYQFVEDWEKECNR